MNAQERFFAKVDKNGPLFRGTPCWLWTACCSPEGYGFFSLDGKNVLAHRVAYMWIVGPIDDGMQLDHLCRRRNCVNPVHTEQVTNKVNVLRGEGITALNARKTHCPKGHEYTEVSTYVDPSGSRCCRTCRVAQTRAWRERKAAAA